MAADNCPIINIFIDWNPIYTDEFLAGDLNYNNSQNVVYVPAADEANPWSKLIETTRKLQVLFLRASGLTDKDFRAIATSLKGHATLKVLDVSSNRDLT